MPKPAPLPALAVEIGGTKLQACLGDTDGNIVATLRGRVPEGAGAEEILAWFPPQLEALIARAEAVGERPCGIGVGFGGPVDSRAGVALVSHQVGGWDGFPLGAWFTEHTGLPATVANDANAAGWAEYRLGAGRGTRHFAYMNIGSGIGGALILDGRLHNGQGRGAGEIGHTLVADWTSNTPGAVDKLEHLCSGWRIERRLRASADAAASPVLRELCGADPASLTCAHLAEAARRGDAFALAELARVAATLGQALANVVTLFHPERIAIGGGVGLMGEVLLRPLREAVDRHAFGPFRGTSEIVPCELEEAVVLAGALLLCGEGEELATKSQKAQDMERWA